MKIELFRCNAEKNRLKKTNYLTGSFTISGQLVDECDVLRPSILIKKSTSPLNGQYNYMYISEFQRYYYITIENVNNTMWRIKGKVDVLFTYYAEILNNQCIVSKTQANSKANLYLNDGSFVMDSRKWNQVQEFPYGFGEGENILICAGGV